jgi:hypothetical protein
MKINETYWLGDKLDYEKWKRFTLFHKVTNENGGSVNTPIARLEIIKNPGQENINPHIEVKIVFRNIVKKNGSGIIVDTNFKGLNEVAQIIASKDLDEIKNLLVTNNLISEPFCVTYSIEDEQNFFTSGKIYDLD